MFQVRTENAMIVWVDAMCILNGRVNNAAHERETGRRNCKQQEKGEVRGLGWFGLMSGRNFIWKM